MKSIVTFHAKDINFIFNQHEKSSEIIDIVKKSHFLEGTIIYQKDPILFRDSMYNDKFFKHIGYTPNEIERYDFEGADDQTAKVHFFGDKYGVYFHAYIENIEVYEGYLIFSEKPTKECFEKMNKILFHAYYVFKKDEFKDKFEI